MITETKIEEVLIALEGCKLMPDFFNSNSTHCWQTTCASKPVIRILLRFDNQVFVYWSCESSFVCSLADHPCRLIL
jgi:hypothetical protein